VGQGFFSKIWVADLCGVRLRTFQEVWVTSFAFDKDGKGERERVFFDFR
jgi:hypothetical protein